MYFGQLNGHYTFDAINHLLHEMCSKLRHFVEAKHRSQQYHEERVQKIGVVGSIGVHIDRNGCAVLIFKGVLTSDACALNTDALWIHYLM